MGRNHKRDMEQEMCMNANEGIERKRGREKDEKVRKGVKERGGEMKSIAVRRAFLYGHIFLPSALQTFCRVP